MENLIAWIHKFHAQDYRCCRTQKAREARVKQIKHADVFVVGREQPAAPAGWRMIVIIVMGVGCGGGVAHSLSRR